MSDAITRLNAALEGRYAIERELGEGGMATVYLADDLKHKRKVALKVLKPELAAVVGAERFLAEITTTANLTHPHILPLHDSGEADSFLFYVMPHIEGESLRERIDREKQLGVDDAVAITQKVANALDYAHQNGVVHRDIKPGNILLSEQGEPLIADFGIALAVAQAGAGRITETGLSLGTPHYMSPEQATGDQNIGPPTDLYALGCVLYEMLVGEPPYTGSTAQAVLGKIIAGKLASATEQRASVPANVDAAIRKALEKLPADRFTSAQDFARALGDEHFRYGELATTGARDAVGPWKQIAIGAITVAAIFAVTLGWSLLRPSPPRPVTRVSVLIPEDQLFNPGGGDLDLSRDGSLMVYSGTDAEGRGQLWTRRWDALDATPIRGTEGAFSPAISPDGGEVAFTAGSSLRVVPLGGGVSRTLAEGVCCPAWSPDGAWVYYRDFSSGGLGRVPAGGGPPEVVTEVSTDIGDPGHNFVDVLPGGRGAVYAAKGLEGLRIQAVNIETGEVKDLTPGTYPRYSSSGHLLFIDDDATLLAAPFDVERLELTGPPVVVAEELSVTTNGFGFFAVSEPGKLVYRTGSVGSFFTPVWVARNGTAREIAPGWTTQGGPINSSLALSPEGTRLAMSILGAEGTWDLWVKQLDSGPLTRLTFEGVQNLKPAWSRDGRDLMFISLRAGDYDVWATRADGSNTAPQLVLDRDQPIFEPVYSPDGTWLVFREGSVGSGLGHIYAMRPGVDSTATLLVGGEFIAYSFALSPNGRWMAYVSNESGQEEIFVRPFPDAGSSRSQISTDGGSEPVWAHSGRELFYRSASDELVVTEVTTEDPTFTSGPQTVLFSMAGYLSGVNDQQYDVSPDDQRFVMLRVDEENSQGELILVENWFEELRQQVPN